MLKASILVKCGFRLGLFLAAMVWMASCAQDQSIYLKINGLARSGKYDAAAKLVEKNRKEYGDRNLVLFNLDRGILYHYAGSFKKSNQAFEQAERRIDDLYTESVSRIAASFLINDNTIPYSGEDFESVIINIFRALNYVQLGDVEGALVEARKVNLKLVVINSRYEEGKKNVYTEDAFARMLMGVLYEMGGSRDELNDAYISNKLAYKAFKGDFQTNYGVGVPALLGSNLLTTASFMGSQEVQEAKGLFPSTDLIPLREKRKKGHLYFIHFAGQSPVKVEHHIRAPMPDGYVVKIAFPRYQKVPYRISGARIRVDGLGGTTLELVEPLGVIAMASLENRKTRIAVKAIARATTKYLVRKAAEKEAEARGGAGMGLLASIAGAVLAEVTEVADVRSWRTLPDRILIGRLSLPPGTHSLTVEYTSSGGGVVSTRIIKNVKLRAGQTKFFLLHTLD